MKKRIITTETLEEDQKIEGSLRPQYLEDYIGQTKAKETLKIYIEAAKARGEALDHVLFYGPPGLGKTTLAGIIANELGVNMKVTSGPAIEKPGEMAAILNNLQERDVLFVDEIHRLNRQVEEVSSGAISSKGMLYSLSVGVGISLGIAMLRVLTGISIMYFLIPGYFTALLLSFFVPKVFTGIAFDSGGVASGPMTATFLLPLAMGACESLGGDVMMDAFGIVAMVAMTPLVTIQILGLMMRRKKRAVSSAQEEDGILAFEEVSDE